MIGLRPPLEAVVKALLAAHPREVSLDQVGEAIGTLSVSTDEVDAMLAALEKRGRAIVGPEGQRGEATLRQVLPLARDLAARLGRKPTVGELAAEIGVSEEAVRHALALGSVIGR